MLLQRSKLAVATVERPRLAPPWSIALLGTLVISVLIAIYPHKALVNRVLEAPQNEITETYLVNLIRTEPENPRLALLLVRHQIASNLLDNAESSLQQVLASTDEESRLEALWLGWRIEEARYERLTPDSPDRPAQRQALRLALQQLSKHDWREDMLVEIARRAIAFGDTSLGLKLLGRLANVDLGRSAYWYAEAARAALAAGEYRASGQFFMMAGQRAATPAEQRQFFIDGLRALQSGDLVKEALVEAEQEIARNPALAESPQILEMLVRFARSVQRPDLADKYARKLLRISLLMQWQREQLARHWNIDVRKVNEAGSPGLPFDDRIYTLGFEAFLDNRKLDDAWRVAAAAVRQAPENLVWRERLARVSEWTGRAGIALTHWLHLARQTGSDAAWQNVLRLAPGLFDDDALRPALEYQLRKQPHNRALIDELILTYERLGDPQGAMQVLERFHRQERDPQLLAEMAALAERMGDDANALRIWARYQSEAPLSVSQAIHVATLLLTAGKKAEAYETLERATEPELAGSAYWRLRGELAAQLGWDDKAVSAYRRSIASEGAIARDHESLARLLLDEHPLEAARISADAWLRFRDERMLLQSLGIYSGQARWLEIGRLLVTMSMEELSELRLKADFLRVSAQYHLATGQRARGLSDLEAAFALSPGNPDLEQALLWIMIDAGEGHRLRTLLAGREREWQPDPAMHDALAAAYLALSLPDVALRRYLTPRLAAHRHDFLWLMNYADALEQNHDGDRAWQLRRQLLAEQVRRQPERRADNLFSGEAATLRRAARARLEMARKPGDPALAVLRELLRLDRDADGKWSPAARDAMLGWWLEHDQLDAARSWLWQQYARSAARPVWAEMRIASESGDRRLMGDLLDGRGPLIARNDRVEVARQLGDLRLAQSEAFDALNELPSDDPLHLQLAESLLAHSHHVRGSTWNSRQGTISEQHHMVRGHVALAANMSLEIDVGRIRRSNRDLNTFGATPDENYLLGRLTLQHAEGKTTLTAGQRESFDRYNPILVEHERQIDRRLSAKFALGLDQAASDSTALRIAGMKDIASVALTYQFTRDDRATLERRHEVFHAQTGTGTGSGNVWEAEYVHTLLGGPRGLEASFFWSKHQYNQNTNVRDARLLPLLPTDTTSMEDIGRDFFVPNDFSFRGIRLSSGMAFEEDYSRAWQPYGSIARTWHSITGPGYDLAAGLAGSVWGADHLAIGFRMSRGGTGSTGLVREFGLNYRLHF